MNEISRRDAFKLTGLAAAGAALGTPCAAVGATPAEHPLGAPATYEWKAPGRPVTAIIIGAGGRGNAYSSYARGRADEWRVVGVADPLRHRNEAMAAAHGIPEENRFATWQHVFDRPKFADVCVVSTPDHLHYGPAMAALEAGYDLLVEKAIAQSWQQCNDILQRARKKGAIVGVGHVLRYSPYFRMMHHVVRSGRIGELVSIQHLEPIERIHMSHSFVRGNWGNSKLATPILLSKSCHDLDILRWIVGQRCTKVQSFGSLSLFRPERAPAGATPRCTDGCPVEQSCPFSATTIYLRRKSWLHHKDTPGSDDASVLAWLKRSNYGRCVFRHDNDVVDHQTVNMEFEGGATVAFNLEGLTSYGGRRTRISGTDGDLVGDEATLSVFNFTENKRYDWITREHATNTSGHGGGDHGLMRDFVQAVSRRDESLLTSNLADALESHLIGFTAEESRRAGGVMKVIRA